MPKVFCDGLLYDSIHAAGEHVGMGMDTIPEALERLKLEWVPPRKVIVSPSIVKGRREYEVYWADEQENFVSALTEKERQRFEEGIRTWLREWREAKTKQIWPAPPSEGPPLPRGWGVRWPWKK